MYFEDFHVGQQWHVEPFAITREQILAFAKDYDPLPLHLDEDYAKTTRFGGLISSGVMTFMLMWTAFIKEHDPLGEELVAGQNNHMAWPAPLYAGDTLSGTVTVTNLTVRNTHNGVVTVALKGYNQDGKHVLDGDANIIVARKV